MGKSGMYNRKRAHRCCGGYAFQQTRRKPASPRRAKRTQNQQHEQGKPTAKDQRGSGIDTELAGSIPTASFCPKGWCCVCVSSVVCCLFGVVVFCFRVFGG